MSERDLQKHVVQLLELSAAPDVIWWHTPNGEKRSKKTAALLKAMGVKAGIPDLTFVFPGGRVRFLELKWKRGRFSTAQKQLRETCIRTACPYAVARTPEEAATVLHLWGAIRENPFAKQRAAA